MNVNNSDSTSFQQFQSSQTTSEKANLENTNTKSMAGKSSKEEGKHSLDGTQNVTDIDASGDEETQAEKEDTSDSQDQDVSWKNSSWQNANSTIQKDNNQSVDQVKETSTGVASIQTGVIFSRDQIDSSDTSAQFLNKLTLENSLNAKDLDSLKPDLPNLPKGKSVDSEQVIKEIKGNPWLTNSFMTGTTTNLMEAVRIKMKQVQNEGILVPELLNLMSEFGRAIGDLQLQKQLQDAQKHQLLACVAMLSCSLMTAAGALKIGAGLSSAASDKMKEMAASPNPASTNAAAGVPSIGKTTNAAKVNRKGISPNSPGTSSSEMVKDGSISSEDSVEFKTTSSSENKKGWFNTLKTALGIKGKIDLENGSNITTEDKSTASEEGRGGIFKSKQDKEMITAKSADIDNVNGTDFENDAKKMRRAENIEKGANFIHSFVTKQFYKQIGDVADTANNLIEMHYNILTGETERETEIAKQESQLVEQAYTSVANDMRDAGQAIDSLLQTAEREKHESSRAHFLGPG